MLVQVLKKQKMDSLSRSRKKNKNVSRIVCKLNSLKYSTNIRNINVIHGHYLNLAHLASAVNIDLKLAWLSLSENRQCFLDGKPPGN